jgi:hypothetical protein
MHAAGEVSWLLLLLVRDARGPSREAAECLNFGGLET